MSHAVYSAWDGTQDHEAYHAEDLLHALMHDLLRYGDLDWARCRQQQIALTTFMVADDEPLVAFVQRLTAVSQGRAWYTTPECLGDYVIEDYLRRPHDGI